jgi:drug/metabolite transporter (DMT)-like permease
MTGVSLALVLLAVLLGAAAQLLLKAGTNVVGAFTFDAPNLTAAALRLVVEPRLLAGVALYGASLLIWIVALSRVEVSIAYPMVSLGYVITVLAAWWWLGEAVTPLRFAGVALIVLGVVLVARS